MISGMKQFLIIEFGQSLGSKIYDLQQRRLLSLVELTKGKSNDQMKTLTKIILPRISLYKVLQEELGEFKKAYDIVEKYMFTVVGTKLNKRYSMFEFLPGYFNMFRIIMVRNVEKSDNWVTEVIKNNNDVIEYKITKCLWFDACIENNCSELCKIFCDVDHIIYGSMKKVNFVRAGTLSTSSDCCDFCFLHKRI